MVAAGLRRGDLGRRRRREGRREREEEEEGGERMKTLLLTHRTVRRLRYWKGGEGERCLSWLEWCG